MLPFGNATRTFHPAGSKLQHDKSLYLTRLQYRIFDKKEDVTDVSKALVVHARTLEIYDQVDLAQTAIAGGEIVQKIALMHDGKITPHLDLSDGGRLTPFPFFLAFEQSKNERLLYEHLQHNGKDVQWQTELESLTQDADGVKASIKTAKGEVQTLEAQYLVGCDGASSPTRDLLNLSLVTSWLRHPLNDVTEYAGSRWRCL
jgi:2-polyprenyl-6-methoxyphenol hydroxylase-like FAD-dependent oxidoreductase